MPRRVPPPRHNCRVPITAVTCWGELAAGVGLLGDLGRRRRGGVWWGEEGGRPSSEAHLGAAGREVRWLVAGGKPGSGETEGSTWDGVLGAGWREFQGASHLGITGLGQGGLQSQCPCGSQHRRGRSEAPAGARLGAGRSPAGAMGERTRAPPHSCSTGRHQSCGL